MIDKNNTPDSQDDKKAKQRHRLLVNPQELGLTARIRKAILEQDMGITQRIKKAVARVQDENSFFYMKKNHFIMVGALLFMVFLFGFLSFRSRDFTLLIDNPNPKEPPIPAKLPNIPFYAREVSMPPFARNIELQRVDIYGTELEEKDYWITTTNEKKVENPHTLMPGVYNLHIRKEGYKEENIALPVGDAKMKFPIALTPVVEPYRPIKLTLNNPLLESKNFEPDEVIIGKDNKDRKNVRLKPGKYKAIIKKAGCEDKEDEIVIPENGVVAQKVTLDYKKRIVKFSIDDRVPYEQGKEAKLSPQEMVFTQQDKFITFENEMLMPGTYNLEIKKDGYEPYSEQITIWAAEPPQAVMVELKVRAREVSVVPNYDIVPPEFKIDKAYLTDLQSAVKEVIPISEGLKVRPGWYWVTVEKANYHPFSKKIFIDPGTKKYEITAHLLSVSKLILLKIRSDFDVEPSINPDELLVDMKLAKLGYMPVDWGKLKQSLPPEKKEIEVSVFLETIPRQVLSEITSDIVTGPITPDYLTITRMLEGKLAEQSLEIKALSDIKAKPGRYMLQIKKVGYDDIKKEVIIYPSDRAYVIREEMKARRVPVVMKVDSDFDPGVLVKPDDIKINNEPGKLESQLKPGPYTFYLQKNGYFPIEKRIRVDPSGEDYLFQDTFKTKPRKVQFDIQIVGDDGTFQKIDPDLVTFDKSKINNNTEVPPKKDGYDVKIEKKGYADIKKHIIIEPSDDPYILKEFPNVLKRRIELTVVASFPKGQDLMPVECTLGNIRVGADTEVKPGRYPLTIIKTAYKPISNKGITIEPDSVPYIIRETMDPKPRELRTDLSYDVPSEDSALPKLIRMTSENGEIDKTVKEGDLIDPQKYKIEITVDGYKKLEDQTTVGPSETAHVLKYTLESNPRNVVIRLTADYPPGKSIIPDKVLLNGQPFAPDPAKLSSMVKPGKYSLVIDKAGYHSVNTNVSILAGTKDFIHDQQMITAPRLVKYELYDAENKDKKELIPTKILLGTEAVTQANSFKPGKYRLFISIVGYPELSEDIEIEPDVGPYLIKRGFIPSSRVIEFEIKGDYDIQAKLDPTEISLNGKSLKDQKSFAPGAYELIVYVPGYQRLVKRIEFGPSTDPFKILEEVKTQKRKIDFNITGTYAPTVKLKPDKVTFNNKDLLEGEEIKPVPGGYRVTIDKEGYSTYSDTISIEPSEKNYILEAVLQTRPRRVEFEINGDFKPDQALQLDTIKADGKDFQNADTVIPGAHNFAIKKLGYEAQDFKEVIEPSSFPFKVKRMLVTMPRPIKIKAISNYTNEPIEKPDICTLNDRPTESENFKPGVYELVLSQSGYLPIRDKVEVVPGEDVQEFIKNMTAKPRKVVPNVLFDVAPVAENGLHVIRMDNPAEPGAKRIEPGDEMKPGEYVITIEKDGYETIHNRWIIEPGDPPATRDFMMVAKMIEIQIDISYDIPPPKEGLAPYTVTFVDKNEIGRHVAHGNKIKPGNYLLEISRPGYAYKTPRKPIFVPPLDKPFLIKEQLAAKPRILSFDMLYKTVLVKALEILIDNKQVKSDDVFNPGQEYKVTAKFQKYKTVTKNVMITPGEAPFVVDVNLVQLDQFDFTVGDRFMDTGKGMVIDNMRYNFEIYIDGEPIEPHHIVPDEQNKAFNQVPVIFYASPQGHSIRVVCAFYYDEGLVKKGMTFRDLRKIDGNRLLGHLRELAKTTPSKALTSVSRLIYDKQDVVKVRELSKDDTDKIVTLLQDLELTSTEEQEQRNKVIKKLRTGTTEKP